MPQTYLRITPPNRPLQPKTTRKIRHRRTPITKHAFDSNLIRQYIQQLIILSIIIRNIRNRAKIILIPTLHSRQRSRALKRPRNDIEARSFDGVCVGTGHDGFVIRAARGNEHGDGGANNVNASSADGGEVLRAGGNVGRGVVFDQVDCLFAEVVVVFQPIHHIIEQETLQPHARWIDLLGAESGNHVRCILLLCVAVERHGDFGWGRFELGREVAVAWVCVDEVNILVKGEDGTACVVEFGAPGGGTELVCLWCTCGCVKAILFSAKRTVWREVMLAIFKKNC
jgi:hypothetical protein